jgi:hypothetical protein
MTIKSLGNTLATFKDIFGRTGNRASNPIFTGFSATSSGTIATPASGLAPGNGYVYHTFTGPGTFAVSSVGAPGTIEVLVVAGGGAGGADRTGGGGGGGGLRYTPAFSITAGSYPVTVGNGASLGGNGSPSIFSSITSQGGGRGGTEPNYFGPTAGTGFPGGSGGGARSNLTASGGSGNSETGTSTPAPSQGNSGGSNVGGAGAVGGSGGGGAGAAGGPVGPGASATAGGVGLQYPQFTGPLIGVPALAPLSGYFAGGGGGGNAEPTGATFAPGGLGGGGNGQSGNSGTSPSPGTANSGGGGGGAGPGSGGGTGGPGIVIIRYLA